MYDYGATMAENAIDMLIEEHAAEEERRRDAERAAARMAAEVAQLRARVAELEAELLDVEPCSDCDGEHCAICVERTEPDPARRAALHREAEEIGRTERLLRSDRIRSDRAREDIDG
jgi:hypothetical protein